MSKGGRREGCRAVHDICHADRETEVATQEFDTIISKVFNFHSIRSVLGAKLNMRSSCRTDVYKYKIDTGNDGNLMPIKSYKMFFSCTNVNELNKFINKK